MPEVEKQIKLGRKKANKLKETQTKKNKKRRF